MINFKYISDLVINRQDVAMDIIELFCGEYLGGGISRDVFVFNFDPKWVVKVENDDADGDNWAEWRVWQSVAFTIDGTKDWFADCGWICSTGRVMLQRRTKPLETKVEKHYPDKIPGWFTDIKEDNFGWIGKQLVCHDYTSCIDRFGYFAMSSLRLQKFLK